jgi:hypothetical protein
MTEAGIFELKRFASLKQNAEAKRFTGAKRFHVSLPWKQEFVLIPQ